MTDTEMTCERFEERLADYMEGVHGAERALMDAHAASCGACGALLADLRQIVAEAAALPPIEPPAAVWAGIESRVATAVVPIVRRTRSIPLVRALTAAAAMVLVTATLTYLVTVRLHPDAAPAGAQIVAQLPASTAAAPVQPNGMNSGPLQEFAPNASYQTRATSPVADAAASAVRAVRREDRTRSRTRDAASVYDDEIARLRSVIKGREDLDPKTVALIQRSLAVIDTAIAQARAAVAADPASAFLNKRLADAQNKKVELLRTAAMLPST